MPVEVVDAVFVEVLAPVADGGLSSGAQAAPINSRLPIRVARTTVEVMTLKMLIRNPVRG